MPAQAAQPSEAPPTKPGFIWVQDHRERPRKQKPTGPGAAPTPGAQENDSTGPGRTRTPPKAANPPQRKKPGSKEPKKTQKGPSSTLPSGPNAQGIRLVRPPQAPRNLGVYRATRHSLSLQFEDASNDENRLHLERRRLDGRWHSIDSRRSSGPNTQTGRVLSMTDEGKDWEPGRIGRHLLPGTEYCYRAVASNSRGASASAVVCGKTLGEASKPGKSSDHRQPKTPTDFRLINVGADFARFGLEDHAFNDAGFNVRVSTDGTSDSVRADCASCRPGASTGPVNFDVKKLDPDTNYCFRAVAVTNIGVESGLSNEVCARTNAKDSGGSGGSQANGTVTVQLRPTGIGGSGFRPFAGQTGNIVGARAVTIKVQDVGAAGTIQVHFVKPGRSTSECGDPKAIVSIGDGQTLSSAQVGTVFGSQTPAFPIGMVACVSSAPPNFQVNVVLVKVDYTKGMARSSLTR